LQKKYIFLVFPAFKIASTHKCLILLAFCKEATELYKRHFLKHTQFAKVFSAVMSVIKNLGKFLKNWCFSLKWKTWLAFWNACVCLL